MKCVKGGKTRRLRKAHRKPTPEDPTNDMGSFLTKDTNKKIPAQSKKKRGSLIIGTAGTGTATPSKSKVVTTGGKDRFRKHRIRGRQRATTQYVRVGPGTSHPE